MIFALAEEKMPYIETPNEFAETIADLSGVYGAGLEVGDHPIDCKCRICFVLEMEQRIRNSVANEARLLI